MNLILNDDIECYVTVHEKKVNIDGEQNPIFVNKKFYCSYKSTNQIAFNGDRVETIANGIIRINGDIFKKDYEGYGGQVEIFGSTHDIIKISRCRNLLNSKKVDFTEIIIE